MGVQILRPIHVHCYEVAVSDVELDLLFLFLLTVDLQQKFSKLKSTYVRALTSHIALPGSAHSCVATEN